MGHSIIDVIILDAAGDSTAELGFAFTAETLDTLKTFNDNGGIIIASAYTMVQWANFETQEREVVNTELSELFLGTLPNVDTYSDTASFNGETLVTLTATQPWTLSADTPWFHAFWSLTPGSEELPPACSAPGTTVCADDGASAVCFAPSVEAGEELCGNGIDDNCNCETDEGFDTVGDTCTAGEGSCATEGSLSCNADGTDVECSAVPTEPQTEQCDGVDNDCDGTVDEDFPGVGEPCDGDDSDLCENGTQVCSAEASSVVCEGDTEVFETCNGTDDNCDGNADEGFDSIGQARLYFS